jgi:hypothetical protein
MPKSDHDWLQSSLEQLNGKPLAQARLLLCSGDLPDAWQRAVHLGEIVQSFYWREFSPYGRGGDFPFVREVATQLLKHRRPVAALTLLRLYLKRVTTEDRSFVDLVANVLDAVIHLPPDHIEVGRSLSSYDFQRLLDFLRISDLDEDRLATLEWQLLPARGFDEQSPVLERQLARDPEFFVKILSLCFKPKGGDMEQEIPETVSTNAFRLLHDWKVVPGSKKAGGEVDEGNLMAWIAAARHLATAVNRTNVCDIHMGQVFAHSRQDPDGTWPTLPVRNALEHLSNEKIESGFWSGAHNKQGVTSRGLTDGGEQEYKLADKFDQWARQAKDGWPRTASVLRSIAESYRSEGRREDEEAERFKRGLDR